MNSELISQGIFEAKKRIREKIFKDSLLMFFSRVYEDLKKEKDPNFFGRVKDLYIMFRPYDDYYDYMIYDFFCGEIKSDEGIRLNEKEISYVKVFTNELKRDFHLNNPGVMKGRVKGIIKKLCEDYLTESVGVVEPVILLRIICAVGGVERLKDMPGSTIQLIGAEKALFRHITIKKNPPKYGLLYYSRFVQESEKKGKKARELANKLAISIKVDYFRRINTAV